MVLETSSSFLISPFKLAVGRRIALWVCVCDGLLTSRFVVVYFRTPWTECSKPCDTGLKERRRYVLSYVYNITDCGSLGEVSSLFSIRYTPQ